MSERNLWNKLFKRYNHVNMKVRDKWTSTLWWFLTERKEWNSYDKNLEYNSIRFIWFSPSLLQVEMFFWSGYNLACSTTHQKNLHKPMHTFRENDQAADILTNIRSDSRGKVVFDDTSQKPPSFVVYEDLIDWKCLMLELGRNEWWWAWLWVV